MSQRRTPESSSPEERPTRTIFQDSRQVITDLDERLRQLNLLFPGERKKGEKYRDPEYKRLRADIAALRGGISDAMQEQRITTLKDRRVNGNTQT